MKSSSGQKYGQVGTPPEPGHWAKRRFRPGTGEGKKRTDGQVRWMSILEEGNVSTCKPKHRKEAIEGAKALSQLVDFEGDLESAVEKIGVSKDKFYRWMNNGKFTDKLLTLAPLLSSKCLADVVSMAQGGEKGTEVRLKANMELIRAFMPVVSREIDFDSNTRKQRLANQGYLAGKVLTMKDQLKVMAKDPFVDYAAEITKIKEEPLLIEDSDDGESSE